MSIVYLLATLFGVILFNEFVVYYIVLYQVGNNICKNQRSKIHWKVNANSHFKCNWPSQLNDSVKAMILADTHLLGPFKGHWLDKLRREWQMYRTFQSAITIHQPDVVFILGDIFDEGQWVDDTYFQAYVHRFQILFRTSDQIPVYSAIGNHDVGFHYR